MSKKRLPSRLKTKPWDVRIVPRLRADGKELWGQCRFDTREIVITKATERHGIKRSVFLHELFHKLFPWMDEDAVEHAAIETDEALEAMDL